MTGMEYMLYEVQEPNFFVFRKQKRDSPEKVTPTSAYYVLDGSIYQAPNLHNVIGSRVVCVLAFVQNCSFKSGIPTSSVSNMWNPFVEFLACLSS